MSRRRRFVAIGAGALLFGLVVTAAIAWWRAGEIVARRAEQLARERYGIELSVSSATVTMSGIALEGVIVALPEVDGFVLHVDEIRLAGSPFAIASKRLAAVSEIAIVGGRVRIVIDDATLAALVRFRRARRPDAASPPAVESRRPPIRVEGISVDLVDATGVLAHAEDGRFASDGGPIRASAASLSLGEESTDHVGFRELHASIVDEDGLRARTLDAQGVDVRWVLSLDALDRATETNLVRRLREALATARRALRSGEPDESVAERSRLDRFTTRDFVATAGEASVATGRGADEKRLRLAGLALRRLDATRISLAGEGEGEGGISARWNLELEPSAMRAVGTVRLSRIPLALVGPLLPEIPWEPSIPGMVSVDVELESRGLDEVALRGALQLEGVALAHPRLAATPLRDLALRIEGDGTLRPIERRFILRTARFITGQVPVEWNGVVELGPDAKIVRGRLSLPSTSCERAIHAIPADVLGPLTGFHLGGTIAGRIDVDLDTRVLDRTLLDVTVDDQCGFESFPEEVDLARFEAPFHHEVLEPDGSIFAMETGPGTPLWVSYVAISPFMVDAVLAHEDGAFFRHRGFAPWAIRDALVRNLREGRYVVGASTITMQLAKNLFLHREKTLIRKVQEVLLTWWLERSLDKDRILELYLNVIEYGPGIYGLRSAASYYFSCAPSQLTPVQAAFLATVLPAPKLYGVPASGEFSASMRMRLDRFLRHMSGQGRLAPAELEMSLEELGTFRFRGGSTATYALPSDEGPRDDGTNPLDFMPDVFSSP